MDQHSDTRPEVHKLYMEMLRKVSPVRKMQMLGEINQTVKVLALAGLKSRYPNDSPGQFHRRLADLLLGPELACKVYGPLVEKEENAS